MSGRKAHQAALAATLAATMLVVLLAWRGLRAGSGQDLPSAIRWREAGEADLF